MSKFRFLFGRIRNFSFDRILWMAILFAFEPAMCGAGPNDLKTAHPLPVAIARSVAYQADVKPILEQFCYQCHGTNKIKGGLSLNHRQEALKGGDSGPAFLPGNSTESRLIRYVSGADPEIIMPPKGARLTQEQIGILRAWIDQGAVWPDDADAPKGSHWAFQSIRRPMVPRVQNRRWVRNPIDAFVLARLEQSHISPSPEATPRQLIRRLKLDLLGLPPSPEEVEAFVHDRSQDAYNRLVEHYLASPHYGERWGRHWLDVARYADSGGYEADLPRTAWHYRDWVINALNADLPFDEFVIEQIAGDLLPNATRENRIATAFHANNILDANLRWESVLEQVNTTGVALLGLTVGCAQCHNHKTDPLSNREYYQLYAFFNNAISTNLDFLTAEETAKREALSAKLQAATNELALLETRLTNEMSLSEWEANLSPEQRAKLPFTARQVLQIPREKRSAEERTTLTTARLAADSKREELVKKVGELRGEWASLPIVPVLAEQPRQTHVFVRGNPEREGEMVQPGIPAFLPPMNSKDSTNRLDLAHWLVSRGNPLTARVFLNRVWMHYFGLGFVETENDFGVQTPQPTHLELLDWLASEFSSRNWSMKAMHQLIVCSAVYRQSSQRRPDLQIVDPRNRLLARQQRLRLEAEIIRDVTLDVSGLLSQRIGGPSVFPYQSPGVLDSRATKADWVLSEGQDRYRRGMYTWFWRLTPHPFLTLFDSPDANTTCTRRNHSNTPVQALTLLNDPAFFECARALATRALRQGAEVPATVQYLGRLCLSRDLENRERTVLCGLVEDQLNELSRAPDEAKSIVGKDCPPNVDRTRYAAWIVASRAMLNLDEFITRE